jgi:hypothetical protein
LTNQIMEGLNEALAFARGELKGAKLHVRTVTGAEPVAVEHLAENPQACRSRAAQP